MLTLNSLHRISAFFFPHHKASNTAHPLSETIVTMAPNVSQLGQDVFLSCHPFQGGRLDIAVLGAQQSEWDTLYTTRWHKEKLIVARREQGRDTDVFKIFRCGLDFVATHLGTKDSQRAYRLSFIPRSGTSYWDLFDHTETSRYYVTVARSGTAQNNGFAIWRTDGSALLGTIKPSLEPRTVRSTVLLTVPRPWRQTHEDLVVLFLLLSRMHGFYPLP
ncbi:hypothetical protein BKA70DRAFT_1314982 [Coprinopsis sp. MPI-PUGE-AT-0042]|nr:hypothetical protein BKA70DRAFT_1314982 [Coprinopsis sp. MPI-PUGE-AT-0042]